MGERIDLIYRLTRLLARFILWTLFAVRRDGVHHLPETGGFVLLPKHQRWEDIPLLALACPRPLYYVAKAELFASNFKRRIFTALGGIPLDRQRPMASRDHLRIMMAFLSSGEGIVVFPEGTYYPDRMGSGRIGVVRMLLSRIKGPFIPVGIRYVRGPWRTRVCIRFGEAVYGPSRSGPADFANRMMREIANLSGLAPP
jgi:1-acyl-sn-glycerol-3-phosphate acyltransferase